MRILLVENQRVIARQTTKLLRDWGHDIVYCGHEGSTLLGQVDHHPPDLILTGFYLRGSMQAVELVERLWTRWDIPVVVLSGADPTALPAAWHHKPGLFFLSKPFLPTQLYDIIEEALHTPSP